MSEPIAINFGDHETEVPAPIKNNIRTYVGLLKDNHDMFVSNFGDALEQFQTTVSIGTEDRQANAIEDIALGAVGVAVNFLIGELGKAAPAVPVVVAFWKELSPKFTGAGSDARGLSVADWIHDARAVKARWRGAFDKILVEQIVEDVTLTFLESPDSRKTADALFEAIEKARSSGRRGPDINQLELQMYARWINFSFDGLADEGPGCIDYRLQPNSDGFTVVSCTVQAPGGKKIAHRLNRLKGVARGFARPIDLRVRKRVGVCVSDISAGRSWSCGWLDEQNTPLRKPLSTQAQKVFQQQDWRLAAGTLFEADQSLFANPSSCADVGMHAHAL